MLDFLPIPSQLAGRGVECDDRIGIEIVALSICADEILPRISGSIVDDVGFRIVGARHPRAAATVFAAFPGPTLRTWLNRLKFPQLLAGVGVDAVDLSSGGKIASSRSE